MSKIVRYCTKITLSLRIPHGAKVITSGLRPIAVRPFVSMSTNMNLPTFPQRHTMSPRRQPGLSPGSLEHIGEQRVENVTLTLCDFGLKHCDFLEDASVGECLKYGEVENPTWVNVCGLHETALVSELLTGYGVPPLLQEDAINTFQRPKVELLDGSVFVVMRSLEWLPEENRVCDQQVSLIITAGATLSLHERPSGILQPLKWRLQNRLGRIRRRGVDYLGFALLDLVIDHYFVVITTLEAAAANIESRIDEDPQGVMPGELQELRSQAEYLHRVIRPVPELIRSLRDGLPAPFTAETVPYLSDLLDHSHHAAESADRLISTAHGLRDQHSSEINTKMNESMRVLAAVATIFMPLTFLAGVYGMNFRHIPELELTWFYPALWIVFLTIGVALFIHFRKRGWI